MNIVILIGRLTKDPEYRDSGVCKYTLAVDRTKDGTDFISCVCFGKSAEFARDYLRKGMKVAIEGRLQTGSYEGKNGKVYTTDVIVSRHEFCERRSDAREGASKPVQTAPQVNTRVQTKKPVQGDFEGFFDAFEGLDEELPFN